MAGHTSAVQLVGTVTVGASGTTSIYPAKSNSPFRNLSIVIVPMEQDSPYDVAVYHNGEIEESHSYPDAASRVICEMSFTSFLFPANVGTNAIPKFFDSNRSNYPGLGIRVALVNRAAVQRSYYVYAIFEEFGDHCRFGKITQEA